MLRNQKGWVLIDALVGIIVLSVALTAMAMALSQSIRGTLAVSNRTTAAYLAQQQLSKLGTYDNSGLDRTSSQWSVARTTYTDPNSKTQFSYQINVLSFDEMPVDLDANVIPVKITIDWNESSGSKTLQVIKYYSKQ